MTREVALRSDKGNWMFFAETQLGMSDTEAECEWYNANYVGKYLVCESREDNSTRLFIREVTEMISDTMKKQGWWNIFTVTDTPTKKGLYISKAVSFRIDRNGYINLKVENVRSIDEIEFDQMFSTKRDGTWKSVAWWYMITQTRSFFNEYDFRHIGIHNPNITALLERHPELTRDTDTNMGVHRCAALRTLDMYLKGELPLEEIEECLNTPTDWEKLVDDVWRAVARGNINSLYGEQYPLFAKKVTNNVTTDTSSFVNRDNVDAYLLRQTEYYQELVDEGIIEPVGDFLEAIESALRYRKALKDAEKEKKKAEKKAKKNAKNS